MLDPNAVVDAFSYRFDHNVDLMWCASDVQHVVVDAIDEAGDNANMTTRHGVFAVRPHTNQLGTPFNV